MNAGLRPSGAPGHMHFGGTSHTLVAWLFQNGKWDELATDRSNRQRSLLAVQLERSFGVAWGLSLSLNRHIPTMPSEGPRDCQRPHKALFAGVYWMQNTFQTSHRHLK